MIANEPSMSIKIFYFLQFLTSIDNVHNHYFQKMDQDIQRVQNNKLTQLFMDFIISFPYEIEV